MTTEPDMAQRDRFRPHSCVSEDAARSQPGE
jgi:hypothetical protein